MKPSLRLVLVPLILVVVFGGGGWYLESQRARKRSVLSGVFESQATQVSSRLGGRVARRLVQEGDPVRADQPLLELEVGPTQEEAAAKQAQADQAEKQRELIETGPRAEDIARQEAVVAEAQAGLARLRNGALPEELAQARARVAAADAGYRKALAGPRAPELAGALAGRESAAARLAQLERGLTPEEKAQTKARLDAAVAVEAQARTEEARYHTLFDEGAGSRQQWEQAQTGLLQATARRRELEEAERRAAAGTPAEEKAQARQELARAQAAYDLVRAGTRPEDIAAARASLSEARAALTRVQRGGRREEIAAASARLAQARAVLAALKTGSRPEERAQARAAARAARALARSAAQQLTERVVRAPQAGIVERVLVARGDLLAPGATVARLAVPDDLWLRVFVPEAQLPRIAVGSQAQLRIDGIAAPVEARVESIATQGEFTPANLQTPDERGKQVFGVRLRLTEAHPQVHAGTAATVVRLGDWEP